MLVNSVCFFLFLATAVGSSGLYLPWVCVWGTVGDSDCAVLLSIWISQLEHKVLPLVANAAIKIHYI